MRAQERKQFDGLRRAFIALFNDLCASGDVSPAVQVRVRELLRKERESDGGEQADA